MNTNVVFAVCRRDLRSWFSNPTGYIFIGLFVLLACFALIGPKEFFSTNLANLDTLNSWYPLLMVGFVPALTMGMWTRERYHGTQELLFTLPARDVDVLLGKTLAGVVVYTLSLVFTLVLPIALSTLGSPDWGQLFANYVGYWLLGCMLIPVAMLGSQLSQDQAVAFILGALFVGATEYAGLLVATVSGKDVWNQNGPLGQFTEFARGTQPASGFLLFAGFGIAFFQVNLALLSRRHWRTGDEPVHGALRFVSLGVGSVALTVLGVHLLPRFDSTFERIHSLSSESKALIAALDPARPVTVTAYVSEDVQDEFVGQKRQLLSLLDQFRAIGGDRVQTRIKLVTPYSEDARTADKEYGIRPVMARIDDVDTQMQLGYVVDCGTEEVVDPLIEPGVPLEYELTRSIRTVANTARKRVGILRTDVEMSGGFDMQTYQPKRRWQIHEELGQQYKVENVDPDKDYDGDEAKDPKDDKAAQKPKKEPLSCLIVPQPSSLTQEQMDRLKGWILGGRPTLLLEDPVPLSAPGTAADDQKGGTRSMFGGGGGPQKGDFPGFLSVLGLRMPPREVVWDSSSRNWFDGRIPYKHFVFAGPMGMSEDSPITKGLQTIVFMTGGEIEEQKKEGFTVTPLVCSPDPMKTGSRQAENGTLPKFESGQGRGDGVLVWDPFGSVQMNPQPFYAHRVNAAIPMAVRVASKPADGQKSGVNLIFVADLDVIGDQMFQLRKQNRDPNLRFDNVPFVLNCIDSLSGDESLIEVRKRRPMLRHLTTVEKAQVEFERAWADESQAAEEEARNALQKAQDRLDEAVKKIRENTNLDEQAKEVQIVEVEKTENRKLEFEKAQIDTRKHERVEMAAHKRDEARRGIYNRYRGLTLGLSLVAPLIMGVVTFLRRRAREEAIVPQNRMVHGGAK